jgi:hypothetical protein
MGPVLVVVLDVADDEPFELSLIPDDGAVEQLSADRSDPALSERVRYRRADGGPEDPEAFGAEDLVEAVDELAAAIAHESTGSVEVFGVADEQVACCLGGQGTGRVRGGTGVADVSGFDVNEEQDVVPAQGCGLDGEEVARDGGLGAQELSPDHLGAPGCGVDAMVPEDLPHGRWRDRMSEADEFAVDAPVPAGRILSCEAQDEAAKFDRGGRPAGSTRLGLGPVGGDAFAVPAQQCFGCDDPAGAESAGEGCCDGAEQAPVIIVDFGPVDLSAQNHELVA